MLSTYAIQWCIENCVSYAYGDDAKDELRAIIERINELEAAQLSAQRTDDIAESTKRFGDVAEKLLDEINTRRARRP